MELYDIETDSEVFKQGILTLDPVTFPDDPEAMLTAVYKCERSILDDGKFIVGIGGEHTISVGLVRANVYKYQFFSILIILSLPEFLLLRHP